MTGTKRGRGSSASELSRRRKTAKAKDNASYAAQRELIISSAAAVFSESGYDRTTLSDIAKRAGTDRATMYYYISSKEELFKEVTSGFLEINLAAAEEIASRDIPARDKLQLIIEQHMSEHEGPRVPAVLVDEMHRIADAGTTWSREVVERIRRYESVVMDIVAEGINDGTIRRDVPPRIAMNAIFGMLNWAYRWYRPGGKYTPADVAAGFAAIALDGLCQEGTPVTVRSRPRAKRAAKGRAASA